ncbi:MAG: beta-N-acetylglucosaminidase [Planctomycetota bacterium]|nr:MAG: beta-N-acetylglucosaminidase [Planctomycetota bacterium]
MEAGVVSIVPQPSTVETADGLFALHANTRICVDAPLHSVAQTLVEQLAPATGWRLTIVDNAPQSDTIFFKTASRDDLGDEGYRLSVTPQRVTIEAATPAGAFYATQTLRQLLPADIFRAAPVEGVAWTIPAVRIEDRPRYRWRGLMLDPARRFLPKHVILRMIDLMALHKLNTLHLHLTDDQGWRIEIRKYPRLTEVGAWRSGTLIGHYRDEPRRFDGVRHGGYYTQADLREIVAYAAQRHIAVVPEIEMPGHATAALAAYPEFGTSGAAVEVSSVWGVHRNLFAPRAETFAFLKDVLTEVMAIFPGRFIHVGGDEAVKDQWQQSDAVQARIRELGLTDESELQSWFIRSIDAFLTEHDRRLVGWDEILEGGLAPGATVMSWRGLDGGIAAARAGHDVVMAPTSHTYFDYYQSKDTAHEPLAIGGFLPLERVYAFEPTPPGLTPQQKRRILGAQGQLWGEYIGDPLKLEYMAFPRVCALAEVVWSPADVRDYDDFLSRLRMHLKRLDVLSVPYRRLDSPAASGRRPEE